MQVLYAAALHTPGSPSASPQLPTQAVRTSERPQSSGTSFGKTLNDTPWSTKRNSNGRNKSSNVEVSPSISHPYIHTSQADSTSAALPEFAANIGACHEVTTDRMVVTRASCEMSSSMALPSSAGSAASLEGRWQHKSYMYRWLAFYVKVCLYYKDAVRGLRRSVSIRKLWCCAGHLPPEKFKIPSMAENVLDILQMSCFCGSFVVWNSYAKNTVLASHVSPFTKTKAKQSECMANV